MYNDGFYSNRLAIVSAQKAIGISPLCSRRLNRSRTSRQIAATATYSRVCNQFFFYFGLRTEKVRVLAVQITNVKSPVSPHRKLNFQFSQAVAKHGVVARIKYTREQTRARARTKSADTQLWRAINIHGLCCTTEEEEE